MSSAADAATRLRYVAELRVRTRRAALARRPVVALAALAAGAAAGALAAAGVPAAALEGALGVALIAGGRAAA